MKKHILSFSMLLVLGLPTHAHGQNKHPGLPTHAPPKESPVVTVVPTGALSINIMFDGAPSSDIAAERDTYFYPSVWLGARILLGPTPEQDIPPFDWAPFASLGLEVEPHALWDQRQATYFIPTLRLGGAFVPDAAWGLEDLRNPTFQPLHAYVSVGVRSRSLSNRAALRAGVFLNGYMLPLEVGFTVEFEQDAPAPRGGVKLSLGF